MTRFRLILLGAVLTLAGISMNSCSRNETDEPTAVQEEVIEEQKTKPAAPEAPSMPVRDSEILAEVQGNAGIAMPPEYLDEELVFEPLASPDLDESEYAVVGSNVARFYPGAVLDPKKIVPKLEGGIAIPRGTLLPVYATIESEGDDWVSPYFEFEKEYNIFRETRWNGTTGLVFGADLIPVSTPEEAAYITHMYTRERTSDTFRPFNGPRFLNEEARNRLVSDRIAFEATGPSDYSLSLDLPDDMVAAYAREFSRSEVSVFLTTDLMIHSLHLLFDKMLTHMEETRFISALNRLLDLYLAELTEMESAADGSHTSYSRGIAMAKSYLSVGKALLELIPSEEDPFNRDYSKADNPKLKYTEKETAEILSKYDPLVQLEVERILAAKGFDFSPIFLYREDYSQYIPRGHYTKSTALEQYFRAMMWFGRIQFYLSEASTKYAQSGYFKLGGEQTFEELVGDLYQSEFSIPRNGKELTIHALPAMYILNHLYMTKPVLSDAWASLFDPVIFIIGKSDDLNFRNLSPYLENQDAGSLAIWMDSDEDMLAKAMEIKKGNPPPAIAGNSVRFAPAEDYDRESGEEAAPSSNFRFFGQRFTFDSHIFTQLSAPRIPWDRKVNGTDVMTVLGSEAAKEIMYGRDSNNKSLEPRFTAMAQTFASRDPAILADTFYNRYLYLVESMATFEKGQGFYFTEGEGWNTKALISSHASWAELRHDTILYVKQSYAERAGGGPIDATYRIEPYPRPIHYVEPNLEFFYSLRSLLDEGIGLLKDSGNLPPAYEEKFAIFSDITEKLTAIVEYEVQDKPISDAMNEYIVSVTGKLAKIVLPPNVDYSSYTDNNDQLKMALIADVHTDTVNGVLEVATGRPYRIYVALNDGDGGKRIATGYIYSYYEFYNPGQERKTDEEWKQIVYGDSDLQRYLPYWLADSDFLLQ
ncbi:MAG: hypothetical protein CSA76_02380 [Spirochaetales bacterium]|nr:MAG: hypothetical protein CSA76_02380 [Spirochaetales bacterium]